MVVYHTGHANITGTAPGITAKEREAPDDRIMYKRCVDFSRAAKRGFGIPTKQVQEYIATITED